MVGFARYGIALRHVISTCCTRGREIWTDSEACFRIFSGYVNGTYRSTVSEKAKQRWVMAHKSALDVTNAGAIALGMGKDYIDATVFKSYHELNNRTIDFCNSAEAFEKLRLSGSSRDVAEAHSNIMYTMAKPYSFRVLGNYVADNLGAQAIYRVSMFTVLVYEDAVYILDHAHLEIVRAVMRTLEGYARYAESYRSIGGDKPRSRDYNRAFSACLDWLGKTLIATKFSPYLAKHMKHSMAMLQNRMHDHKEKLDMGMEARHIVLQEELDTILKCPSSWFSFLLDLPVCDRDRLDLAYMYHLLPPSDATPYKVFSRVVNQLNNANKPNEAEFEKFLNYCKANDVAKVVHKTKGAVTLSTTDGHDPKKEAWYKNCIKGKISLPKREDWGKAYLSKVFDHTPIMPSW